MKRLSAALMLLFTVFFGLRAANPDFAYPKATIANAEKNYESAIQSPETSGIKLIKSLLEISGATAAIDPASLPTVLPRIDRAIDACPDGVIKALALTVKADIVYAVYNRNRWKYDRNKTPDEPLPADITEWNGRQFRSQIEANLNSAFDLAGAAPSARLSDYSEIITADRPTLYFLPTVCDFVASKAIDRFEEIDDETAIKTIINRMIDHCRYESAPWFWWSVKKIQNSDDDSYFNYDDEYDDDDDDDDDIQLSAFDRLYLNHKNCEEVGYALLFANNNSNDINYAPVWLLPALKDYIARYPNYILINDLKNRVTKLTQPKVNISTKSIVAPSTPFEVKICYNFVGNCGFTIYSISKNSYEKDNNKVISLIKKVSIATDATKFNCDTVVSVTLPAAGYYKIVPTANIKFTQNDYFKIKCIPFLPCRISGEEQSAFIITDYTTGAPVSGVKVKETSKLGSRNLSASGSDGIVTYDKSKNPHKSERWVNFNYVFSYKGQEFNFFENSVNRSSYVNESHNYEANIFTDRQLYHPGDTIKWSTILYGTSASKASLSYRKDIKVSFFDTNGQPIEHLIYTTDDFGRAKGQFTAPENGLTGKCRIEVRLADVEDEKPWEIAGRSFVTVSDFKLPTFKVENLTVSRDLPRKGDVTLGGRALTYSGMPVAGAKVEIEIWSARRWRWFSPMRQIGSISGITDAEGSFSIVAPDSLLVSSGKDCFIAEIAVASVTGEAQHVSKPFTTGKPYTIVYSNEISKINSDLPYSMPVAVYDADGNTVDNIALRWWLNNPDDGSFRISSACASGVIKSGKKETIDLSKLKSGLYYLSVEPVDSTKANRMGIVDIQLYSIRNSSMPAYNTIFCPKESYTTDNNGDIEIVFGTPGEKTYVYSALGVLGKLESLKVTEYASGFHDLKVHIPEEADEANLFLHSTLNGNMTTQTIYLRRPDRREISLEGITMRDRLQPGTPERWVLKLTDNEGKPIAGAMVATMFTSALNALEKYRLVRSFNIPTTPIGVYYRNTNTSFESATLYANLTFLSTLQISTPDFNPSLSYSHIRDYLMKSSRSSVSFKNHFIVTDYDGVEEDEDEVEAELTFEEALNGYVAGLAVSPSSMEADESVDYLVVETGIKAIEPEPEFEYRPSEVLQAFWMPELTFDQNGEAFINFTVPNANTTWSFNAFGWTKDLRATTMIREFTASKPVMVQPNLPRFLRAGDKAKVLATVFNNSEERAAVTTVVELFDFSTGKVYATSQSTDTIAPAASAIASIEVEADGDASVIGYRVRSTLGKFTDGEQAYIPVEAATSDVIESEVFYLNPGDAEYTMTLPKGKNMQSTLDYTDNPAWNIIKQLPGLAKSDATTSTGATRQLFGAATAAGMLKAYPAIVEVLKMWIDNPDSQALTSRLSQNDELKAAILSETPWVQAAASDSHRMARLSLLFDKKATSGSIDAAIATLRKLQRADGGWSWGGWSEQSSLWATNIVLQDLGRLNVAGYLPSGKGLEKMIADGIAYYESMLDKNTKTDYALTYIVSMFPGHKLGLRGTQVVNATIQEIVGGWKSSSTLGKAVNALILNASGYKNVAKEIIGSLRQFAVASPSRGTSFPSVNDINMYADLLCAFASIEPDAPEIDGMRQWLVIHEQATTDLNSVDPTRLIAAFTACGSQWLDQSNVNTTITAGGAAISTDEAETATGHIISALPSDAAGKQLAISRDNAVAPAYGSVISRFKAKSTDVKASSCDDLSVEKRIMALRNGKWQYVDEVIVGEQVRVLLTIKAKRALEYVTVIDGRPASFEPVDQLPGWVWSGGAGFYRENRDSETRLFINYLPKGTYQITIDMTASLEGTFTSGIATVQSQLAPSITAHSAGTTLRCLAN